MAIKTLRVFQEFTSEGYVPMPPAGNIDYGYTIAGTFPETTPATFQTDDPDLDVTVTEMTDFYVWIRSHGAEWNINYTRNVRVYPDSPLINNVVMGIIIANYENALPVGGTTGQILAKIDNTDYNAEWIDNYADWTSQLKHQVKAGVALTKGQAVYVSGADGTNMVVSKASNVSESTSSKTLGLIAQNLALNAKGFVITEGLLTGLDTSTATVGDAVWLGTNGNLIYGLANKPYAPAHLVFIGIVTRVNNSNGEIFVKVQNGFELDELHNVQIISPDNNQALLYDSASSLWKNANIQLPITLTTTGASGASTFVSNTLNIPTYTLIGLGGVPTTRTITINGTLFDLSADRTWNVGTVTSVSASVPTGFAISGSPITSSGTLAITFASGYSLPTDAKQSQWDVAYNKRIATFSYPLEVESNNISIYQSSPTSSGYLSSADYITFNSKQSALSGTGFVKANGTSISYDDSTYVPTLRTITINGTTFDLSANRSWTVGSELTASAPLSITSGVISITQASTTTNGYLSSTDWNTFNTKQTALNGTGFVKISGTTISYDNTVYTPTSRLLTINGTAYDLSADRSWTITPGSGMRNVQTFTATSAQTTFTITGGYTSGLVDVYVNGARLSTSDFTATNGTTVVLGVGVVSNDIVDVISYTASLSSGINGSGTTNYVPKFTSSNVLGNSLIFDNGTNVGIGTATPSAVLHVIGTILSSSSVTATSFVKSGGTSAQILAADGSVITAGTNITISGGVISSSGGGSSGSGTTNYISKWTSSSVLGNASLFDNGNIGLGTTNPDFVSSGDKVFTINGTSTRSTINLVNSSTGTTGVGGSLRGYNGSTFLVGLDLIADGATNSGAYVFYGNNVGTISEKFRITSKGGIIPSGKIVVQNGIDGGATKGINLWLENDNNWGFYMAQAGAGKSMAGATACGALDGSTSWGVRSRAYNGSTFNFIWENHTESPLMSLNAGDGRLWVSESLRTKMVHLNTQSSNQGHRIYSRTMDVNSYTTATNMRFTVAAGYNVQFQYEVTFHATRTTSGNLAEIWYLKYTAGITYNTSGNPNERWWSYREQDGNGIAGIGRNNQNGYFEIQNSAYDSGCRLTCVVAITCSNWDAVTVTFP